MLAFLAPAQGVEVPDDDQEERDLFTRMNRNDKEKVLVLLRSFATAEDLKVFITATKESQREIERRRWAWDMLKRFAAAIVLVGATVTALRNVIPPDWFGKP